ncbi:ABC transporter substrate-binding protein, partial [Pseudomonas syringae]
PSPAAAGAPGVVEELGGRVGISSETLIYPALNGFGGQKGNDEVRKALEDGREQYSKTPEYAALLEKYKFQAPTADDIAALLPKP